MKNIITDPKFGYKRVEPIPSVQEVEKYYKEDFYSEVNPSFNDSSIEIQLADKYFFNSRWERIKQVSELQLKDLYNKNLYDIGFGYAQALSYFQKLGMHCSGIEPSDEGVQYAKSIGLDNVKLAGIEDDSSYKTQEKQDLVLLINVLEHLRTPFDTLVNVRKHLIAENGVLVIDVPNEFNDFQSVGNREYELNEWWITPPKHINYFTRQSLTHLLDLAGFEVFYSEASFPIEMFLLFGDQYVGNSTLGSECHKKRVNFEYLMRKHGFESKLNQFYKLLADIDLGRQITVYAKPKN
uniref:class I SAM-dependent methyltransferase n=1 Tax=Algoriphagus sp. TaxID=1872435 RepID=UPI004048A47C